MNAKKIFFAGVCLLAACFTQAQESQMPKAFSYQAVVRNSQGKVIAKQPVGIKVEILQGSTEGSVVYAETQTPESSQTGTVNLLIGTGTATQGVFADIDWGAATYFLRISMDLQGGSSYEVVSTTQMLPVPYALYAEKAGSVVNGGTGGNGNAHIDFILLSDYESVLNGIYQGSYTETLYSSDPATGRFSLEWQLIYLTGTDQKLKVDIVGWPEGLSIDNTGSYTHSNIAQGFGQIELSNIPRDTYSLKMVITNESGTILREFPFTYTIKAEEN